MHQKQSNIPHKHLETVKLKTPSLRLKSTNKNLYCSPNKKIRVSIEDLAVCFNPQTPIMGDLVPKTETDGAATRQMPPENLRQL